MIIDEALSTKERNALKDSDFGIPSLRKYPLTDKDHVEQAIRMFNHVDSKHEKELANNIKKAMKKYKVKVNISNKNRLNKYVSIKEDSTTFGTVVGPQSNPDNVYVINYSKNNSFNDDESLYALTTKPDMSRIVIHDGNESKEITFEEFSKISKYSETYLYNGYVSDFYKYIKESKSDIDYYSQLSNMPYNNHTQIKNDYMFTRINSLDDELRDIRECIIESYRKLNSISIPSVKDVDSISESNINVYNDLDGTFLLNEYTHLRTPSIKNGNCISNTMMKLISGTL